MKRNTIKGLVAVAALAVATGAQAQLTITFDTVAETFKLSGAGSGVPRHPGGETWGVFEFVKDGLPITDQSTVSYNDNQVFSTSVGEPGGDNSYDTYLAGIGVASRLYLALAVSTPSVQQTITGEDVEKSYGSLSDSAKTAIAGLDGQTLTFYTAAGPGVWDSGDIAISVVVPEPHEYAAMAALGLLGFAGYRRYRNRA